MPAPLVVGLGRLTVDFLGTVPRLPEAGARIELDGVSLQPGGGAATAVAAAVALGCRGRFAGRVADDFLGRYAVSGLRDAGVDAEFVLVGPGTLSPLAFTAVGRDGLSLGFTTGGDIRPLAAGDLPLDRLLDGAAVAVLDGSSPDAQAALAEAARGRGVPVLLDTERVDGFGELAELVDVLVASERFAAELAPRGELPDALIELQRLGPQTVVITMGAAGSIGLHGDQLVRQDAFPVDAVETGGAGHVYCGALAVGVANRWPLARSMQLASAAAALACRSLGRWAGIPERAEVDALLAPRPR